MKLSSLITSNFGFYTDCCGYNMADFCEYDCSRQKKSTPEEEKQRACSNRGSPMSRKT